MEALAPQNEDNNAQVREYKRLWRQNNTEYIKVYQKEYLKNNNAMVECSVCHGRYKKYGKSLHETRKKHIAVIKMAEMEQKIKDLEQQLTS